MLKHNVIPEICDMLLNDSELYGVRIACSEALYSLSNYGKALPQ